MTFVKYPFKSCNFFGKTYVHACTFTHAAGFIS